MSKLLQLAIAICQEIEIEINSIMDEIHSPITTIPGIGTRMGAMILAEVGDFSNFDSADKILAYAGLSPSTYQSGKLDIVYTAGHHVSAENKVVIGQASAQDNTSFNLQFHTVIFHIFTAFIQAIRSPHA